MLIHTKNPAKVGKPSLDNQIHKGLTPLISTTIAGFPPAVKQLKTKASVPITAGKSALGEHQTLLQGIDTLSITAGGKQPSEWLLEQSKIWNEYQLSHEINEDNICIEFDNKWWELYPYGKKPYKYQLLNKEIGFISIWNTEKWNTADNGKQHILFTFYPKFLHSYTIKDLNVEIKRIISLFFLNPEGIIIQVSRADLHSDISSSKMLDQNEIVNSISRCKFRDYWFDNDNESFSKEDLEVLTPLRNNKGGQKLIDSALADKLYNMVHNQVSYGSDRIIMKKNIETAYWGNMHSGSIWGKVYNKSNQVKVKNNDDIPKLWSNNGWNGQDVVIRVEFSMRRDFLKSMDDGKYILLEAFLNNTDIIWKYLTEKWLRLVVDVKDNNSTWSVLTPFWNCVSLSFNKVEETIIRFKSNKSKINQLWSQGVGCIKQMVSLMMVNNTDEFSYKNTIKALEIDLEQAYNIHDYVNRRRKIGIA